MIFLVICGIMTAVNVDIAAKKLVISVLSFIVFIIITKINVNSIIKKSYAIYFLTFALLIITLLSPSYVNGAQRYIIIGYFSIESAPLVAFSILPLLSMSQGHYKRSYSTNKKWLNKFAQKIANAYK